MHNVKTGAELSGLDFYVHLVLDLFKIMFYLKLTYKYYDPTGRALGILTNSMLLWNEQCPDCFNNIRLFQVDLTLPLNMVLITTAHIKGVFCSDTQSSCYSYYFLKQTYMYMYMYTRVIELLNKYYVVNSTNE